MDSGDRTLVVRQVEAWRVRGGRVTLVDCASAHAQGGEMRKVAKVDSERLDAADLAQC